MPSDPELVKRIAGGGREAEAAFDTLLARHSMFVAGRLGRMVRDAGAADDLRQEVFVRLWTRAAQWDGRGSLRAWLGAIATKLALNHLRSVRRRRQRSLETASAGVNGSTGGEPIDGTWLADASAEQPGDAAAAAELREQVARLLAALPARKRDVLRMVHVEDMNVREAAEELGIPVGTVKSRLFHAREAFARRWQALQQELGDM